LGYALGDQQFANFVDNIQEGKQGSECEEADFPGGPQAETMTMARRGASMERHDAGEPRAGSRTWPDKDWRHRGRVRRRSTTRTGRSSRRSRSSRSARNP
jgi:hypothetical protein